MNRRILIAVTLALLLAGSAFAQMPPGKWWRQPPIVSNLQLTEEQQDKLETIFRNSANELIDIKADVEKAGIALRGELDQPQLNRQNVLKAAARLNDAQGRKFARELSMLIDMRSVLTDAQWNRMRNELDHIGQPGKAMEGQRGMQPRPRMQGRRGADGRPALQPRPDDQNRPTPPPQPEE